MPREPRKPNEFHVHLMLEGGHTALLRFNTIEEVKTWYKGKFEPKAESSDLSPMPVKEENEILFIRPKNVVGVHVEPIFTTSVEMF
ncbi:MAG: hypothetical protein CV045_03505 [Cyanobacteria bacterium M5B4]|nr:MAG: hypothetical protein CV045_03505 [Cyanobacteria bacterium M5B4]